MTEGKLNILADETVVRMAQEGSATAYEYLIQKYREVAKIKARTYYIAELLFCRLLSIFHLSLPQ